MSSTRCATKAASHGSLTTTMRCTITAEATSANNVAAPGASHSAAWRTSPAVIAVLSAAGFAASPGRAARHSAGPRTGPRADPRPVRRCCGQAMPPRTARPPGGSLPQAVGASRARGARPLPLDSEVPTPRLAFATLPFRIESSLVRSNLQAAAFRASSRCRRRCRKSALTVRPSLRPTMNGDSRRPEPIRPPAGAQVRSGAGAGQSHLGTARMGCRSASVSAHEFCWATWAPNSTCSRTACRKAGSAGRPASSSASR